MENYHLVYRVDILNQRRFITDKPLLIFYLSLFSTWIPTIVYAFCAGDSEKILPKNYATYYPKLSPHEVFSYVFDSPRIFIAIGYALLAGVYASLTFIAMRWISHFTKVAFFMVWIPFVFSVLSLVYQFTVAQLYILAGSLFSFGFVFALIRTEWFYLPEKILKESCKMILKFPVTMLFSLGCLIACFLVFILTLAVELFLSTTSASFLSLLTMIINLVVGFWTICIIYAYMQMVLCGAFATWFWAGDKANFEEGKTLLQCMKFTIKYHIGTLAYSTSIFGVFQNLVLLLVHSIGKIINDFDATFLFFVIYNLFDAIVFRFTMFSTVVKCAVEGKGFAKSAEDSLYTFENHPKQCLVVVKITELSLLFALTVVTFLIGLSILGYGSYMPSNHTQLAVLMITIVVLSALFVLPLFAMLCAAYYTILHCFFEDLEIHNGSEDKPYCMSHELQSVINHTGPPRWFCGCSNDDM